MTKSHRSFELPFLVVLRFPQVIDLGRIIDDTRRSEISAGDGCRVDDRLEGRARLPLGHGGPIEIADADLPQVIPFLSNVALTDGDDETAAIAIEGIADREDNIAIAALDNIYANSSNLQRRLAALDGMGDAESDQAVEVLSQILRNETDTQLIAAAVLALGSADRASAVPIVIDTYRNSTDETVRRSAIRALRRLDEYPGANDALLEILEDRLNSLSDGAGQ